MTNTNLKLKNEAKHFDQMVSGKSSAILFYDAPFVKIVMDDLNETAFKKLGCLKDKKVLFYGCGANFPPIQKMMEEKIQKVFAIDISPVSIELLQSLVDKAKISEQVSPEVMDCMDLKYDDDMFDMVYGRAILHHLELQSAIDEIYRVLKPGGTAIFLEPLGMNPFINLYRKLTPERRTIDEHPFENSDLLTIKKSKFRIINYSSCNLTVNLGIFIATGLKFSLGKKSYDLLKKIDDFILKNVPFFNNFCWNIIITLVK